MVASGNNRGNGLNLGAFYVNGNNGWANAYGSYWSSRLSNFQSPSCGAKYTAMYSSMTSQ